MEKASRAKAERAPAQEADEEEERINSDVGEISDKARLKASDSELIDAAAEVSGRRKMKRAWRCAMLSGSWLLMLYLGAKGQALLQHNDTATTSPTPAKSSAPAAAAAAAAAAAVAVGGGARSNGSFRGKQDSSMMRTKPAPTYDADAPASYGFLYTPEGMALLDELVSLSQSGGSAKPALRKSKDYLSSNRHFADACHPLLHRFGRTLYRQGDEGISSAFAGLVDFDEAAKAEARTILSGATPAAPGTEAKLSTLPDDTISLLMVCNAAYLHGIIELFLFKAGLVGQIEAAQQFVERKVCRRLGTSFRPPWECRHGIGHGLIQFQRQNRLMEAIDRALDLGENGTNKRDVWNGIWMDHFASTEYSGHDADDPAMAISVCFQERFKKRGLGECLLYSPTAFLLHRPRAYIDAFTWCWEGCSQAASGPAAMQCENSCVSGVGMQTLKENMDNVTVFGRVCDQVRVPRHVVQCINGGKGYYSFAMGTSFPVQRCSEMDAPRAARACKR